MKEKRLCPHCGAELPWEASFCPCCARTVNQRRKLSPPSIRWRRALRRARLLLALLLLVGLVGTGWYLSTRP